MIALILLAASLPSCETVRSVCWNLDAPSTTEWHEYGRGSTAKGRRCYWAWERVCR